MWSQISGAEEDEETGLIPTFNWSESTDPDLYDELSYTLNYGLDISNMTSVIQQSQSSSNIISE